MTARAFAAVLAPGRFDATPDEAEAAWNDFRSKHGVRLILGTEYGSPKFVPAFEADGWDYFRGGGECVVAWRTDTFEPAWHGSADRIGSRFFRGGNLKARTPLASMPLRHLATGTLLMVRLCHTPAHVQSGDGFRRTTARVVAQGVGWSTSLAVWGRRSVRFSRHHPKAAAINAADFNVDLHRAHWRAVLRILGRCAKPLTKLGDLGGRLISWMFVRGIEVDDAEVMAKPKGFDHHPLLFRLTIKES